MNADLPPPRALADISPVQAQTQDSNDLHALLLEMTDEAVLLHSEGRILLANEAAALLLGARSAEALRGRAASAFLPATGAADRQVAIYPRRRRIQASIQRLDGSAIEVLFAERPCLVDGKPACQVVLCRLPSPAPATTAADADLLTDLPNRRQFRQHLQAAVDRAIRNRHQLWLLYVDLDRFSAINQQHGHAVGDRVLGEAATRLQACVRRTDLIASAGGDEFLIALEGTTDREGAGVVAGRALQSLAEPFRVDQAQVRTSACIGLCAAPTDGSHPDVLLRNVDVALWQAKSSGRNRLEFYSTQMDDQQRRSALAREDTERKLASLTPREQEVLQRLVAGEANKMIAYMLGASMRTIEHHRARIMAKMDAGSLPELVRMVLGRDT